MSAAEFSLCPRRCSVVAVLQQPQHLNHSREALAIDAARLRLAFSTVSLLLLQVFGGPDEALEEAGGVVPGREYVPSMK